MFISVMHMKFHIPLDSSTVLVDWVMALIRVVNTLNFYLCDLNFTTMNSKHTMIQLELIMTKIKYMFCPPSKSITYLSLN